MSSSQSENRITWRFVDKDGRTVLDMANFWGSRQEVEVVPTEKTMSYQAEIATASPMETVKTLVGALPGALTALGQRAENEGHKPGETLLPDDLSQLHSLADQMREILRRAS